MEMGEDGGPVVFVWLEMLTRVSPGACQTLETRAFTYVSPLTSPTARAHPCPRFPLFFFSFTLWNACHNCPYSVRHH